MLQLSSCVHAVFLHAIRNIERGQQAGPALASRLLTRKSMNGVTEAKRGVWREGLNAEYGR